MANKKSGGPNATKAIAQQPIAQMDGEPIDYATLLEDVKRRIREAQIRAAVSVNTELVLLYWSIGSDILARQHEEGWGARVIDRLSSDLRSVFTDTGGFSARNLKYMRSFAAAYPDEAIVQAVLAQIPWYHNIALLDKLKSTGERLWYAQKTIEHGWSRNALVHQIESGLYQRQGSAISNFHTSLPAPQSDLAQQLLKDPYTFDFLTLGDAVQERTLEQGLIDHIQKFLLELGMGFAFVGRQYHLDVGGEDFYLDLLFYHLHLRCYIVIELKVEKFKPEFAGKMNFYLAVVDDLLRHGDDQPSIGLIICKEKNNVVVEYSLRDVGNPVGVARYLLTEQLPSDLGRKLPSVDDVKDHILLSESLELNIDLTEVSKVEKR